MKLLIATTNKGKFSEYRRYFAEYAPKLELLSLDEVDVEGEPVEEGVSFEENALIKAEFYAERTGLMTLADDGGFEIDTLDGEPGVKSRRWPGYEASDEKLVAMVMDKLRGVPEKSRGAQIRSVAVVVDREGRKRFQEEGVIRGIIAKKPDVWIQPHLPFRAVLWLEAFGKYYQNLTQEEDEKINHRREMTKKLVETMSLFFGRLR
jgi:XTP/dITP diphosphohydrolase